MPFYLFGFPDKLVINIGTAIDDSIKAFARSNRGVLNAIKNAILFVLNGIEALLTIIPWWAYLLVFILAGYKISRKFHVGLLYGAMVFSIGCFGLWPHMIQTLSIIIIAVVIALLLGFPLGVLMSISQRVNNIGRPVLDFMQTIPSFVYLIPGAMLFGVGKVPAVMATVIYSVVPMIRLTSHGIQNVDKEVIEAALAFGSTKMQSLIKVEIPQARSTIMAGVNQTIMMAMSMVVTCAIIGANGLGMEILVATNRTEMGRALLPGISIVFIAIILDRITQGVVNGQEDVIDNG